MCTICYLKQLDLLYFLRLKMVNNKTKMMIYKFP